MTLTDISHGLPAPPPLSLGDAALFLDLDGTLAAIAERPQDVRPDPRRNTLLTRLDTALGGRLAVVSGRTLDDIDRILEGRVLAVAAVHGLVRRRPNGVIEATTPHPALADAGRAFRMVAQADSGLLVEEKGHSVALHYRLAPAHGPLARRTAARLAAETGLILQTGQMVVELRTPGPDKGDSVRSFMAEPPFAGARPIFLGDDVTDEDGFAAAAGLKGMGVLIGPDRPTAARWRLDGVEPALCWLEAPL